MAEAAKTTSAKSGQSAGPAAGVDKLSFEQALAELEAIVGNLERGSVPLEESIAMYERGEALKMRCETLLRAAEARVETITRDADGRPSGTAPLDADG
ncbi:exodeoxyribonuclease VII small subunit [Xanthobacter oligotrophicus]|uniref:Exodeoxyribonuclease 7 small subunit n=1 Tax=Xanthobacter oligotrophicus TaxID=2607286 RepID=A0ABW7A1C8_9HYPH